MYAAEQINVCSEYHAAMQSIITNGRDRGACLHSIDNSTSTKAAPKPLDAMP